MTDEREDLDALLASPGWERFKQMTEKLWGSAEGGGERFVTQMTAVAKLTDDTTAMPMMRQIIAAQREIQALMRWAPERLETLKRTAAKPDSDGIATGSRRGGL